MSNEMLENRKQTILELFFCSDDRRFWVIAEITKTSLNTVSRVIQDFYDHKQNFDRGNFLIYHSELNNF
jgi:DNA-directed RNA polymerase specialized sigma subunit